MSSRSGTTWISLALGSLAHEAFFTLQNANLAQPSWYHAHRFRGSRSFWSALQSGAWHPLGASTDGSSRFKLNPRQCTIHAQDKGQLGTSSFPTSVLPAHPLPHRPLRLSTLFLYRGWVILESTTHIPASALNGSILLHNFPPFLRRVLSMPCHVLACHRGRNA